MKKILLLLLLFSPHVFAQVPHTLVNGEIIDADQLNENFAYLDEEKHIVAAHGVEFGYLYSYVDGTLKVVLNEDFYPVEIARNGRIQGKVYYSNGTCSGSPYLLVSYDGDAYFRFPPRLGTITEHDYALYYLPKGTTNLYRTTMYSYKREDTSCITNGTNPGAQIYAPLIPNDPSVTGIEPGDYPFRSPITIDRVGEVVVE